MLPTRISLFQPEHVHDILLVAELGACAAVRRRNLSAPLGYRIDNRSIGSR